MEPCSPSCLETPCDCGEWLHVVRTGPTEDPSGYRMRHGDNPEHTSGTFPGVDMFIWGTREWRNAVHERTHARR